MVVTDDPELARRARHLSTQAKVPDVGYLHDEVGYNYRLTNLAAGLGLAQLARLEEFVERKHAIAARYDAAFAGHRSRPAAPGSGVCRELLALLGARPGGRSAAAATGCWRTCSPAASGPGRCGGPCTCSRRSRGARTLGGAVGESLFERGLSLPCSTELTEADQDRVIEAVLAFLGG